MKQETLRRVVMTTVGVLMTGVAVGMYKGAALGVDPFQVFAWGVFYALRTVWPSLSYGTYYTALSGIMLVIVLLMNRRKIGLGTLINMFLLGFVIDASEALVRAALPVELLPVRLVLFAAALMVSCVFASCYMVADMGVSVYDAMAITWSERSTVPFRLCRIITDVACVVIGGALCIFAGEDVTAIVHVGTIITALCMGPIIAMFNKTIWEPVRYGKKR